MKSRQIEHHEPTNSDFRNKWLRKRPYLENLGDFRCYDIDLIVRRNNAGFWMFVEEKTYMSKMKYQQAETYRDIDVALRDNPNYFGFHVLQFEKTTPTNSKIICLNHYYNLTEDELEKWLSMNEEPDAYTSFFEMWKDYKQHCEYAR